MTDLNLELLALGQPDLAEPDPAFWRGLTIALFLAAPIWMLICGVVWLAVWA